MYGMHDLQALGTELENISSPSMGDDGELPGTAKRRARSNQGVHLQSQMSVVQHSGTVVDERWNPG